MADLKQKLYHSGVAAAIFLVASLPQLYSKSNSLVSDSGNCPTHKSRLLHVVLFYAISVLVMKFVLKSDKSFQTMSKYAINGALLFFLLSSPETYSLTNSVVGGLSDNGCPTIKGLAVHTVVYLVALVGLMSLPKDE